MLDDPNTPETHGHITVNITGGTIGNDYEQGESTVGGNVFGACLGTTEGDIWKRLGRAKQTEVTIEGNPFMKSCIGQVYRNNRGEFDITVKDVKAQVILGDTVQIADKLHRAEIFFKQKAGTADLTEMKNINFKYKNQVVCTKMTKK